MEAGIPEDRIIIDPGIGFGKRFEHNLEIIHNLCEFALLEKPLLVGPSRKAFIGKILGDVPPGERFEGTAAAVAISIFNGAHIVRVHDVKETAKVAKGCGRDKEDENCVDIQNETAPFLRPYLVV